jgi:hypothetical protein
MFIALDMAPSKTGWARFDGATDLRLLNYGLIQPPPVDPEDSFPASYYRPVIELVSGIKDLCLLYGPESVVVEQSNLGKQRGAQKRIEWCHFRLIEVLGDLDLQLHFVDSSKWRQALDLRLNKDQKKSNAKLSKAKKSAAERGAVLDKKELGIRGRVDWKHLSWERANQRWDLKLKKKDHDISDAINIGEAFWLGVTTNENP